MANRIVIPDERRPRVRGGADGNGEGKRMHVVICGAGAIGASIAYFLAVRGVAVTVVERTGVACAASGKSGGFLARDWCDGSPVQDLARRSFELHAELPDRVGIDWGYRRLTTYGGYAPLRHRGPYQLDWLSGRVGLGQRLGGPETTAQVHPAAFTSGMMRAAAAHGAELRVAQATGLLTEAGNAAGVVTDRGAIAGDAVVIAMGPWSILACAWLDLPAVFGLKGHSIVFDTGGGAPAEAAFLEYREASGEMHGPELFPRPDGTTYACAVSSETPLPFDPADVAPDPGAIERLQAICSDISPALAAANVLARQACFRPIARDGLPLIGRVAGIAGAYVATGHGVWGILNAPATGEAVAELITEGRPRHIDLAPFSPGRMPALDPARLRFD
jgi:glycine/D-amino acid oxidase-like deaminating enzyme